MHCNQVNLYGVPCIAFAVQILPLAITCNGHQVQGYSFETLWHTVIDIPFIRLLNKLYENEVTLTGQNSH